MCQHKMCYKPLKIETVSTLQEWTMMSVVILQEAKAHQRFHEKIKAQENKMSAIDLQIEK